MRHSNEILCRFWILSAVLIPMLSLSACDMATTEEDQHDHQTEHLDHQTDHDDHDDHGSDHGSVSIEEAKEMKCEHGIAVLDCDECRYEVGAVDVAPGLMDEQGDGLVSTKRITLSAFGGIVSLTGEVAFDEAKVVHVGPRIKGVARRVFANLGDRVDEGARLVEMDSLEMGRLRSSFRQARAKFELTRQIFEREKRLFEKRITSSNERLQAETAHLQAQIDLDSSREQLGLLGYSEKAIEQLADDPGNARGRITIRSPIAGQIVAKHVVTGEQLPPDKEIFTIADLTSVWVWANLYETDLPHLLGPDNSKPLSAKVTVAAFPGRQFGGVVDYVGATMDETTRTLKVRIVVSNSDMLLRPGMFAEVSIDLGTGPKVLQIPAEAIVDDEGKKFVFARIGERRFLRRNVRIGAMRAGMAEVLEGLVEGDEIVVRGAFLLKSDILREKMGAGCAD